MSSTGHIRDVGHALLEEKDRATPFLRLGHRVEGYEAGLILLKPSFKPSGRIERCTSCHNSNMEFRV